MKNANEILFENYLAGELPLDDVLLMIERLECSSEARMDLLRLALLETHLFESFLGGEGSAQADSIRQKAIQQKTIPQKTIPQKAVDVNIPTSSSSHAIAMQPIPLKMPFPALSNATGFSL